jgi:hypothetical protein
MTEEGEVSAAGTGDGVYIVVQCSIVVVELPEHVQAIEDALPRGIGALGLDIRLWFGGEVHGAFIRLAPRVNRHVQGLEFCGKASPHVLNERATVIEQFTIMVEKVCGKLPLEFFAPRRHEDNSPFYLKCPSSTTEDVDSNQRH